jgi:putative transposase
MANLFVEVLRSCMRARRFTVHDFVVMPDHVHILLTVPGDLSVEKAMQFVKGGFSFRAGKELNFRGEIWQRGFSDVRITDDTSLQHHREYIHHNPVKAGLVDSPASPYESSATTTRANLKPSSGTAPASSIGPLLSRDYDR